MTFRSGLHLLLIFTLTWTIGCKKQVERIEEQYGDEINAAANSTKVEFTMVHTRFDSRLGRFVELSPPATKRNPTYVSDVDGKLLVFGGVDERGRYVSEVERYEDATDTWEQVARWPRPGIAFAFSVGHHLCTCGGYDDSEGLIRRELDCYDSRKDEWSEGPDLPLEYSSSYPAALDGRIYLAGGSDADLKPVASVWSYAPGESQWQREADLPEPRALMGVQAVGDKLYLIGGITSGRVRVFDTRPIDADLLVYDPRARDWRHLTPPAHSRALFGLAEVQGKLALYFGVTTGPEIELYDPATDTWMDGSPPPTPIDLGAYIPATLGGDLFTLALADRATRSSLSSSSVQWQYDGIADQWSKVAERGGEHQDAAFSVATHSAGLNYVGAHTDVAFDQNEFWERVGVPMGEVPPANSDVDVSNDADPTDAGTVDASAMDAGTSADATPDADTPSSNQDGGDLLHEHGDAGESVRDTVDAGN